MTSPSTLWDAADQMAVLDEPAVAPLKMPIQTRRRRGYSSAMTDRRAHLHLMDDDGMRRWVYEPPAAEQMRRRASRGSLAAALSGDVLRSFSFIDSVPTDRGPNQITQALIALDGRLTPNQGLRRWNGQQWVADPQPVLTGKTLLLVHGTFSNSDMYTAQWALTPKGQALWQQLQRRYGNNILAFDHPTLSVAPWINALDLATALRNVKGQIDVLAHSRGGLVTSWWLRLAPARARQVIFVGSPLDGTSLASPYRLRAALDHMATVADLLAAGGQALATVAPMAAGAAGLAKIFGRTLKLGASLPLVDAAVALVPGLASQQRTSNNPETTRLFAEKWLASPVFAAVTADFQPQSGAPLWKVWERLKAAGAQLVAGAADAVFDGANDLVVDTAAMNFLGTHHAVQPADLLALGPGNTYHTSYFTDDRVTSFLDARLA
jgi:pimeloyl-ACP methyl ester carboxylesterase